MENCIFCKIAKGEIPCAKVYEDEQVFAFLDVNPNTSGHTLVIPKRHFADLFDIDPGVLQKIVVVGKEIAAKMKKSLGAAGVHLSNNNGADAGQMVMHFHLHVIPRYENDGLQMYGERTLPKPMPEELSKLARKIKI